MDFTGWSEPKTEEKTKGQLLKEDFRAFLNDKWYEHKDELLLWENKFPEYDREYYWRKHRWLLKKMYQDKKRDDIKAVEAYRIKNEKKIKKDLKRGFKKGNL